MKTKDNITTSLRYLRRLRFAAAATALGLSLAPLTVTVHAAPIKEAPAPIAHITREFDVDAVTLPYERITVYDDTMYSDEAKLTQEGCEGMAKDLYLLVLRDWVEKPPESSMLEKTSIGAARYSYAAAMRAVSSAGMSVPDSVKP